MKPTLLVMAAGLGNRYGGLKQMDSVGPNGEILIEYAIYDALQAGFGKLVFVIRDYFKDEFKEKIGSKFDGVIETVYAYQELDSCVGDFQVPPEREKPWGTGHAILVAQEQINEPFAAINADDYYGSNSFKMMAEYLSAQHGPDIDEYAMIGYVLRNTLSKYGQVCRGVCECDEQMFLKKVVERIQVEWAGAEVRYFDPDSGEQRLTGDEVVSMNFWGFSPSIFEHIQVQFNEFLRANRNNPKVELYIPFIVDNLIVSKQARAKVLTTDDTWFGITYRQDKPIVVASIAELIKEGIYPERLW